MLREVDITAIMSQIRDDVGDDDFVDAVLEVADQDGLMDNISKKDFVSHIGTTELCPFLDEDELKEYFGWQEKDVSMTTLEEV
mgnify:CR=1 FL=1